MTRPGIASIALLSMLLGACGGGGDGTGPGSTESTRSGGDARDDSLVDLVRTLPALPDADAFTISFGDVSGIAEANDVQVPADGDVDQLLDWAVSGSSGNMPIALPGVLQETSLARHDELESELGVSLWGTDRFVGLEAAPYRVGVLEGDHRPADLTMAIGEPDGGVWSLGGEELSIDPQDRTTARPLGEALRLAAGDGVVSIAPTARLAVGAAEGEGTLVDDDLDAVLDVLDDPALVSGVITRTELPGGSPSTNGVAYGEADGDVRARLVLGYPGSDAADAASDEVEEYFTAGTSLNGSPWAELLTVEEVGAEGTVVVVELSFPDGQRPTVPLLMLTGFIADLPQARL